MAGEISVDSREIEWNPQLRPGIFVKLLRQDHDTGATTTLLRLEARVRFPEHRHPSGEELFVIDGRIQIENIWYESGCYVYTPPDVVHDVFSDTGAVMLIRMPGPPEILEE